MIKLKKGNQQPTTTNEVKETKVVQEDEDYEEENATNLVSVKKKEPKFKRFVDCRDKKNKKPTENHWNIQNEEAQNDLGVAVPQAQPTTQKPKKLFNPKNISKNGDNIDRIMAAQEEFPDLDQVMSMPKPPKKFEKSAPPPEPVAKPAPSGGGGRFQNSKKPNEPEVQAPQPVAQPIIQQPQLNVTKGPARFENKNKDDKQIVAQIPPQVQVPQVQVEVPAPVEPQTQIKPKALKLTNSNPKPQEPVAVQQQQAPVVQPFLQPVQEKAPESKITFKQNAKFQNSANKEAQPTATQPPHPTPTQVSHPTPTKAPQQTKAQQQPQPIPQTKVVTTPAKQIPTPAPQQQQEQDDDDGWQVEEPKSKKKHK